MDENSLTDAFKSAVRLHQAGRLNDAQALYRQVLARAPEHAGALHLLGVIAHQRGGHAEAVELIARAIARTPERASYHNNLGAALLALGNAEDAIESFQKAIALKPDYADAHSNLGNALHRAGRGAEARPAFDTALQLNPRHADALYNLGNLLQETGEYDAAIVLYRRSLHEAPRRANVWNNLGNALFASERDDDALDAYQHAVAADAGDAAAFINLSAALARQGRVAEAAGVLSAAARLRPSEEHWPLAIAALCPTVFPNTEAIDRYWTDLNAALDAAPGRERLPITAAFESRFHPPSFALAHHGRADRALKARFASVFQANVSVRHPPKSAEDARIGFVVTAGHEGGFRRSMAGIIDGLAAVGFQPIVFAPERRMERLRASIRNPLVAFINLPNRLNDAAQQIATAGCAVLYHWQIGTDPMNYFLPFTRPAPVQCTSWGTHGTSGIPAVDAYLSSDLLEPEQADAHYIEALVRLSTLPTYQRRPECPGPPATRAEFGLPEDRNLYVCFQRILKFHPDFDTTLAAVLRQDRRGLVLIREGRAGAAPALLRARFQAVMPDVADRIVFLPGSDATGYYRLLSLADVVLDPYPYGAGLTAYDILGLGLPLVTLPTSFAVGRYALACYRKMGMLELVAASPEHYVALATRIARDRACRDDIKARIAERCGTLFEDPAAVWEHARFFRRALAGEMSGRHAGQMP